MGWGRRQSSGGVLAGEFWQPPAAKNRHLTGRHARPRPKPILRIVKTMFEDKDVLVRRCREGYEFFNSLRQRKEDLAAARSVSSAAPAGP